MTLPDSTLAVVVYAIIGFVVLLFVSFTLFPKRTRRTVNYLLQTYAELRQAKADPNADIEVKDFETKQLPKVKHPREGK